MPTTPSPLPPSIQQIALESDALSVALVCLRTRRPEVARDLAAKALVGRADSDSIESYVVRRAISEVAQKPHGENPVGTLPVPLSRYAADAIGLAWTFWLDADSEKATDALAKVRDALTRDITGRGMEQHTLALWGEAVGLIASKPSESARLWQRASELATTFGLDAANMIRWTQVATFLPETLKAPSHLG